MAFSILFSTQKITNSSFTNYPAQENSRQSLEKFLKRHKFADQGNQGKNWITNSKGQSSWEGKPQLN